MFNQIRKKICFLLMFVLLVSVLPIQAETQTVTSQRISTTDSGFSVKGNWTASTLPDSTGNTTSGVSYYSSTVGAYAQYTPQNLEPGWYDIYFWNIAYQTHQNPMKLTGTVHAGGITRTGITLPVNTTSADRGGIWSKVGTYYFNGTNDEYFRLVMTYAGSNGKAADVKFEKNTSYAERATYQRIGTTDNGFSKVGKWAAATMADSTGSTTSGVSYYGGTKGDYMQYQPADLLPGWYEIYFWNIAYQTHQNPMKMSGTVYAGGKTITDITLPVNTTSADRGGIWSKVGTYYFDGTNDEYFRLVATGGANARPADVKFERNTTYTAPKVTYQRIGLRDGTGVFLSGSWTSSTVADSTGDTTSGVSFYGWTEGDYVEYMPHNLQPGWYDISFWNIKYDTHQNPMKMSGTVYADGKTITDITLPVNTTSADRGGIWSKVGTYYFDGTNDEYFRLVCTGGSNARPADVKFELNENYQPSKVSYQRIGTSDSGFSKSGNWVNATMADSTGNTASGASLYTGTVGNYAQYTPENLQPGWYDVSFWNIKYQDHQNPIKMTGTVYANGKTASGITLPVNTTSDDRGGIWSKVGTYYFAGTNDEYFRLVVAIGGNMSRAADVKFELNEDYQPPKVTSQVIGTSDSGFSKTGTWVNSTMADSTGSTASGVSFYGWTAGDYVQYTPENLQPGWYDVSFWNIKYQDHQNPIKMTGTVHANSYTFKNLPLTVNTTSADRGGQWSKIGTYYFSGSNDEYLRLVCTGGPNARPADAKFELNESYIPPASLGAEKVTVTATEDVFSATGEDGCYKVYLNKTGVSDGRIDLYSKNVLLDSYYTNGSETGEILLGTYLFEKPQPIKLVYNQVGGLYNPPVSSVSFVPAGDKFATYELQNLQTDTPTFFFSAGAHRVTANVTNNAESANFRIICAVMEGKTLVRTVSGKPALIDNGETKALTVDVPINEMTRNTRLKVYVWDDLTTLIPRMEAKTFQPLDDRQPDSLLLTAYSFDTLGSWQRNGNTDAYNDLQILGLTSSTSTATPASVTFNAIPGGYRVWVHSRNYTDRPEARYFNVAINGETLEKTFGQVGEDCFVWENGGLVELDGKTTIEVLDTSKFYAKFDAILLTRDIESTPPDVYTQLLAFATPLNKTTTKLTDEEMMLDFTLDKNYAGGNYTINKKEKNQVAFSPDLSDTSTDWFYWNFKAKSESDRTVTFSISGCDQLIFAAGPVYSTDDGKSWNYITDGAKQFGFSYDFKANETVQFAVTIPYQQSNLTAYLDTLTGDRVKISTLCKSEENRDVPLVTIGNPDAEKAVFLTSRHHSCESTTSFVLEGLMDYLANDAPDSLFDTYCFYIVPMVDIDGVENGDQGKNRKPHDHNRDYDAGMYSSIRAIKELAATLDVEFFLDVHCPYLQDTKPYLYYSEEDAETIAAFSDVLVAQSAVSEAENPIIFDGTKNNYDGAHYTSCSRGYFYKVVGAPFSTTLEFPYTGGVGDEYTTDRMYDFGIDLAKAIETYITK